MSNMHQYELVERRSGKRIILMCSSTGIEHPAYPQVIKDVALAIEYLRLTDTEIAERYELRYIGEFGERKAGWG